MYFPLAMLSQYFFGPALFLISMFIVLIILLQRGRGGGLTGALGGAGGASAFGVKAGDIFTRITAVSVLIWIVLCAMTCYWYLPEKLDIATNPSSVSSGAAGSGAAASDPVEPNSATPAADPALPGNAPATEKTDTPISLPPAANTPQPSEPAKEPLPTEAKP